MEHVVKGKSLKLPGMIIAIGLILALAAGLFVNRIMVPTVTEHDFHYAITYQLCGETKTLEGIYRCKFTGLSWNDDPRDRYYTGEYIVDGQSTASHSYTIAQKDGAELYIVMVFNEYYLMGDTKHMDYEPFLEEPYLEAVTKEGNSYDGAEMPKEFAGEIISWEYPEPIENTFVFSGFSILHTGSMAAMLAAALLTLLACLVFVKKDQSVSYKGLDRVSVIFNAAVCILAIPFITVSTAMLQLTMSSDSLWFQMLLGTPALTGFTVAASIALRRKGFTRTGFFVQLVGPALFIVPVLVEEIISNIFG